MARELQQGCSLTASAQHGSVQESSHAAVCSRRSSAGVGICCLVQDGLWDWHVHLTCRPAKREGAGRGGLGVGRAATDKDLGKVVGPKQQ